MTTGNQDKNLTYVEAARLLEVKPLDIFKEVRPGNLETVMLSDGMSYVSESVITNMLLERVKENVSYIVEEPGVQKLTEEEHVGAEIIGAGSIFEEIDSSSSVDNDPVIPISEKTTTLLSDSSTVINKQGYKKIGSTNVNPVVDLEKTLLGSKVLEYKKEHGEMNVGNLIPCLGQYFGIVGLSKLKQICDKNNDYSLIKSFFDEIKNDTFWSGYIVDLDKVYNLIVNNYLEIGIPEKYDIELNPQIFSPENIKKLESQLQQDLVSITNNGNGVSDGNKLQSELEIGKISQEIGCPIEIVKNLISEQYDPIYLYAGIIKALDLDKSSSNPRIGNNTLSVTNVNKNFRRALNTGGVHCIKTPFESIFKSLPNELLFTKRNRAKETCYSLNPAWGVITEGTVLYDFLNHYLEGRNEN
ncbi:hypothetical protein HN385_02410 [archaeon]|jgi:hypothetical protein|nr:hypothetical protein [archaeon]MBT3450770.1 hypothetical protein [archaeon]MBT6868817.1 hypothetical protein [archaeon]MBT7192962.1 hypothetical protein [archaeon]MBT7380928.1 hypothetical protein [archaeon]